MIGAVVGVETVVVAGAVFIDELLTLGVDADVEADAVAGVSADTTLLAALPKILATADAASIPPQHGSDEIHGSVPSL